MAFLVSMGWIAHLDETERQAVLDEIGSRVTAPEYRRSWETHVHWSPLA